MGMYLQCRKKISGVLGLCWAARPLPQPKPPDMAEKSLPLRVVAKMGYALRRIEFFLSPRGGMREWLRLNIVLLVCLGFTSLIFIPLLSLIASAMLAIATVLMEAALALLTAIVYGILSFLFLRILFVVIGRR